MIDDETGLRMTMAVQSKPQNPRLAENNVFQIVTWTKGLGDTHRWRSQDEFLSCILTHDHLMYRLRTCDHFRRPTLSILRDTNVPTAGYAFASYDLLRLELDAPGDIGPDEVKRAEDMLLVELLTYEEYIRGQVYAFSLFDRSGTVIETQDNIYGEDYAEHLARTAFDNHRMGIGADNG